MPLTHISIRAGKPEAYRQAIFDSLNRAMHETFDVPADNQFMVLSEHAKSNFRYAPSYLNIRRTEDIIIIQITANDTRTPDQRRPSLRSLQSCSTGTSG